jgi:hypothetical protein
VSFSTSHGWHRRSEERGRIVWFPRSGAYDSLIEG